MKYSSLPDCGEGEFSRTVTAIQAPVSAPIARGLLRSLALREVSEWWRRNKTCCTKRLRDVRERDKPPHKPATYRT